MPPAIQQALARRAVREAAGGLRDLAYRHVRQVLAFVRHPTKSRRMDLAIGVDISMENEWLVFRSPGRLAPFPEWEGRVIPVPGTATLSHPDWEIHSRWMEPPEAAAEDAARTPWRARIDPDQLHPPLIVRRRKHSESFHPSGMPGPVRLGDFLASHHMAFSERDRWPLLCDAEGVVWIPGYRLREGVAPENFLSRWIEISVERQF